MPPSVVCNVILLPGFWGVSILLGPFFPGCSSHSLPHFSLRFTVVAFLCAGIEHTGVRGRHRRYRPGSEAFPRVQLDRPWPSTPRLQRRGEGAGLARAGALEPDALREGAPQLTSTRFWFPLLLGLHQHLDTPTHVPTRTHARMHAHPVSWDYKDMSTPEDMDFPYR